MNTVSATTNVGEQRHRAGSTGSREPKDIAMCATPISTPAAPELHRRLFGNRCVAHLGDAYAAAQIDDAGRLTLLTGRLPCEANATSIALADLDLDGPDGDTLRALLPSVYR